jgi:hypothetical protein
VRAYLIDEIHSRDMDHVKGFLKENAIRSSLDEIFWVQIPDDLLSETQYLHAQCRPHVFAVELGSDWIKLELFVRSLKSLRCDCQDYCTSGQRDYVFRFAEGIIERLDIRT